jgi:hypothetical protein
MTGRVPTARPNGHPPMAGQMAAEMASRWQAEAARWKRSRLCRLFSARREANPVPMPEERTVIVVKLQDLLQARVRQAIERDRALATVLLSQFNFAVSWGPWWSTWRRKCTPRMEARFTHFEDNPGYCHCRQ